MKIEKISNNILIIISGSLLMCLTVISFCFTQRIGIEGTGEICNGAPIYDEWDNPLMHFAAILAVVLLWVCISYIRPRIRVGYFHIASSALACLVSFCILAGGDQIQVCSAAALFNQGNFINLTKGGYINMYPHQLGLVTYYRLLFRLFGEYNYVAIQCINCLFIGGIVYFLCLCIRELSEDFFVNGLGAGMLVTALPLLLLSSWLYGDIPAYFFSAVFLYSLIRYSRSMKVRWLFVLLAAFCLGVLLRKNVWIVGIAVGIVLILLSIKKRNWMPIIAAVLLFLLPLAQTKLVEAHYETVSGYEIDGGIPSSMWIAMGMIDGHSKPGWFNNYCVSTYYSLECDRSAAKEAALETIQARGKAFMENPVSALSFYKRKICTQWNDPYFNTEQLINVDETEQIRGISAFLKNHEEWMRCVLSLGQTLIYTGALLYCITAATKRSLYENIFLITFVGGFLFSVIWEANSRYVYLYVLFLIPVASVGWEIMITKISSFIHNRRRISEKRS